MKQIKRAQVPASPSALRLRELTLAGFGVYREPTRFLFPEGNAILFGPNETGKSTLMFGLAGVWFGLPATTDPGRIGTARFRSFGNVEAFFGELLWERDERRYRLHRDFETHKIRLTEESTGQIELLFEGEHNPLGRSSAGSAFPPILSDLLGFASWDLFLQTFCLSQPLPEGNRLGADLQHLLSGSQDARIDDVRERIFSRIKELTRGTGEMGLTRPGTFRPTNQRDQGRIEELESRVGKIRLQVEHGRIQLERLNQGNDAIEQAQAEQQEISARRDERRRRCATLGAWSERQQERMRRSAAVQLLRNAATAIQDTVQERSALMARRSAELNGLGAPFAIEPELERVERAAREHARLLDAEDQSASDRGKLEEQRRTLEAQLGVYADVRGRTDWAEAHAGLARLIARRGEIERELAEMRARFEAAALPIAESMSVEACRVRGMHYLEAISRLETIEARTTEIRAQLEERSYLQENGRSELLKEKFRLESELKECSASLREGRARAAADQNAAALDAVGTSKRAPRRDPLRLQWIGIFGWAALTTGVGLGIGFPLPLTLLVSIGSAAILFAILRIRHGARANAGAHASGASRGRSSNREVSKDADTATSTPAPPSEARDDQERPSVSQLRLIQRKIEDRLQTLSRELGPYAKATSSEISRMEGRWQALDDEAEALVTELVALRPRLAIQPEAFDRWRDTEVPQEMIPLLELPNAPKARSHRSMIEWLRALDEDAWQTFFQQERARRDSEREWTSLEDRISARNAELEDRTELEQLEDRLRPFSLSDDPESLARRSQEASQLERQIDLIHDRLTESARSGSGGPNTTLLERWNELLRIWPAAAKHAPWSPGKTEPAHSGLARPSNRPEILLAEWAEETRNRLREAAPLSARIDALTQSESKILATENCSSRVELEQRLAADESALGAVVRELEVMTRDELFLSAAEDSDPEARARRLEALFASERADEESDRDLEQALETKIRDLHRKQAALEGEATPNVAALEIEVRYQEDELDEMKRERDALAMAYIWMEEAQQAYQQTHRAHLADQITRHFQNLTGVARRIVLDERFEISALEPSGDPLRIDQLSQGARDQLLLAIRFGVADLLSASIPIPFFFDDPFVHFDAHRLELVREALNRAGRRRPWVLLTHRAELISWADPIFVEESHSTSGEAVALPSRRVD